MTPAKYLLLTALMLVMAFAGCKRGGGGWGGGGFQMPPMPVETDVATVRSVADRFSAIGTVEAENAVTIVAEIPGTIVSIPYSEGAAVAQGSLIAQLDDSELRAEYDRAVALKEQTQASFNRVKNVVDQGAGSAQDLDDAAAALRVAEANAASAKARLDKTRITAPFAGLIGARRISKGAYVRPGDPITELASVQNLRVIFSVPERYLSDIKKGSEVTVSTTAYPGYDLHGRIDVVEPVLDPATRSTNVVARVHNPDRRFRSGMSANISAVLTERGEALTISSEAVFVDQGQPFVYVINPDSTVKRAALQLGTRMSGMVEVTAGLAEGDRVVRAGHQKIMEGGKVIPVMSQGDAAAMGQPDTTMTKGGDTAAAAAPEVETVQ